MIRRPPRSTQSRSSAASDVYKRQAIQFAEAQRMPIIEVDDGAVGAKSRRDLSLIHISEPTRLGMISYAVFCLKKKKKTKHIENSKYSDNNYNRKKPKR